MPVVNPGIRRYIGSAIQRLFNSASFSAPLTHSLTLERGTGSPTFTRATTATFQDFEGVLRTVPAGCARFTGARFVYNRIATTSEDFSNAAWTKGAGVTLSKTVANPLDGASTATLVTVVGATTGTHETGLTNEAGTYLVSEYFKKGSGRYPCIQVYSNGSASADYITLDMDAVPITAVSQHTGSAVQSVDNITVTELSDGWVRVSARVITSANLNLFGSALMTSQAVIGYATGTYNQYGPLLENITGRTDQTTPSEYVSVGVLSAPYHGAGADGVEFFDTDLDGNALTTLETLLTEPAATNLCTKAQEFDAWTKGNGGAGSLPVVTANDGVAPDGTTTADKVVFAAPGAGDLSVVASPAFATVAASVYTSAVYVKAFAAGDVGKKLLTRQAGASGYTEITLSADWQRLGTTETAGGTSNTLDILLRPTFGGSSGTVSCYLWGAQVELGSAATSYIPTTTLAVARNADVLTYTGGDISNLKTLAATFRREAGVSVAGWAATLSDGTVNNYMSVSVASATQARFLGVSGGATQWDAIHSYTAGTQSKASFSAATNDIKMDKDGTAQTQDTSATVPTVTQLNAGHVAGSFQLNGHVGHIYGWTTNKSQPELGAIDR
jgi:hypothetical protein